MGKILDELLIYEILSVVEEIPEGKVASYGQIARLIGRDRNSRLVGKVLSMAEFYGDYPCHRVVNHAGRTAPHFRGQKELLLEEGVEFTKTIIATKGRASYLGERSIGHQDPGATSATYTLECIRDFVKGI